MEKRWGVGGSAVLSLGTIHWSFWRGREYLCAYSGSSVSSLYAVCHKDLNVNKTDISHTCREKDLEICVVELETEASKLIILSMYRAPTGDFNQFLKKLDTLKYLIKPKTEFLLCGDINTDYLLDSNRKKKFIFFTNNL